jgi:hypothetical protein
METVYIETTIVSYLAADKNADAITSLRQEATQLWWEHRRPWFACFISEEVVDEAGAGDQEQVRRRLEALRGIERLPISREAGELAAAFLETGAMPQKAARDAVHLAVATCSGMDFLLTWNYRHLANAQILRRLNREAEKAGWRLPQVCTPQQLME